MSRLVIYIEQRFYLPLWMALSAFVLLMSELSMQWSPSLLFQFGEILLFLFTLRLYDDLQNRDSDRGKYKRIYTEPKHYIYFRNCTYLFITFCLVLQSNNLPDLLLLTLFFLTNHVLYTFFLKYDLAKIILPILKYPFIGYFLTGEFNPLQLALFFAILSFDLYDDLESKKPNFTLYLLLAIAFLFQYLASSNHNYFHSVFAVVMSSALMYFHYKYAHFVFLGLLLLIQIFNYELSSFGSY